MRRTEYSQAGMSRRGFIGAGEASLVCNARDFYYPLPRPKPERPPEWDAHVRDWAGRSIHFAY